MTSYAKNDIRKAKYGMKNTKMRCFSKVLCCALAAVLLLGAVLPAQAAATGYAAGGITRRDDIRVDYTQYLNGDVVCKLPDTIRADEEISVIISTGEISLMDAYKTSAKTMSFGEYALCSEAAAQVRGDINAKQAQLLARLDEQELVYTVGEQYDTLLAGFELLITASDFAAVCGALEGDADVIVGEVYRTAETKLVENTVNVFETGIFNSSASG